jgi:hypothetical protein
MGEAPVPECAGGFQELPRVAGQEPAICSVTKTNRVTLVTPEGVEPPTLRSEV